MFTSLTPHQIDQPWTELVQVGVTVENSNSTRHRRRSAHPAKKHTCRLWLGIYGLVTAEVVRHLRFQRVGGCADAISFWRMVPWVAWSEAGVVLGGAVGECKKEMVKCYGEKRKTTAGITSLALCNPKHFSALFARMSRAMHQWLSNRIPLRAKFLRDAKGLFHVYSPVMRSCTISWCVWPGWSMTWSTRTATRVCLRLEARTWRAAKNI